MVMSVQGTADRFCDRSVDGEGGPAGLAEARESCRPRAELRLEAALRVIAGRSRRSVAGNVCPAGQHERNLDPAVPRDLPASSIADPWRTGLPTATLGILKPPKGSAAEAGRVCEAALP